MVARLLSPVGYTCIGYSLVQDKCSIYCIVNFMNAPEELANGIFYFNYRFFITILC